MNLTRKQAPKRSKVLPLLVLPAMVLAGCTPTPASAPTTPQRSSAHAGTSASAAPSAHSSEATSRAPTASSRPPGESDLPGTAPTPTPSPKDDAQKLMASMSLKEKVGQVLMVGFPATGSSAADRSTITENQVGNFFLKGRSSAGTAATADVVHRVEKTISAAQSVDVDPFVATDQEGGNVQVLKGKEFSTLPTAVVQGSWDSATLRDRATGWGKELAAAGINVNLAPVADTVPSASFAPSNAPIGYWKREFGYDPAAVSEASRAFSAGMSAAGVDPVIKHFPGLGRVTQNTDTAKNVTDTKTTRNDAYLEPFRDGIDDGNNWMMVANAYYSKIDPKNIAPFSSTIMRGMLREDLGFDGVIVSDDMCDATQLSQWGNATRAQRFFAAGGTMMLCVDAGKMTEISGALVDKATADPDFAQVIDDAALRVLEAKDAIGS